MRSDFDFVLVGGGLANGLVALALRARDPHVRIAMIERGATVGGNHTWCFHAGDLAHDTAWIEPLVACRWPGYDVAFPAHARRLESPYACVTSERLAREVAIALATPGSELVTHATALSVDRGVVMMEAAGVIRELRAPRVIDARGPDRLATGASGWQTFFGQELVLAAPHGLERPIVMDATVDQASGFRFWYVLPLAADRVLVEDTRFSDTSYLDAAASRAAIAQYAAARGWSIASVAREESGVLALPLHVAAPAITEPLVAGYAGGWFHPVTGYSFPVAVRLARAIASGADLDALARAHAAQLGFALRLNRMLFRWFAPERRYHVLEQFYRLPEPVIRRFYALELGAIDRARIVVGRPPRGLSLRAVLGGHTS